MALETYDLFITHAWRYHDDWTRLGDLLDEWRGLSWRNFSVPWHDPAIDPNTELGGRLISEWIEQQIAPTHAVLALDSVYEVGSARRWVTTEIDIARRLGKPVFALPVRGRAEVTPALRALCDDEVPWVASKIIGRIDAWRRAAASGERGGAP